MNSMFAKPRRADPSLGYSAPSVRTLHGVPIRKLTFGRYAAALKMMEDLPALLAEQAFPGENPANVLARLGAMSQEDFFGVVGRLLITAPEVLTRVLCPLLNVTAEHFNRLGLNELTKVLTALWEENDLTDFLAGARRLWSQVRAQ
jgi:hypothetical protein